MYQYHFTFITLLILLAAKRYISRVIERSFNYLTVIFRCRLISVLSIVVVLKIAESFNEFVGEAVDDETISLEDTTSLLNSYIDAVDTDLDKDRIKTQMHDLMIEAQTMEIV